MASPALEESLPAHSLIWVFSALGLGPASFMLRLGSGRNYVRSGFLPMTIKVFPCLGHLPHTFLLQMD
jgi:hypothetical protein